MRLALMQPYFFPYLGYFELIARADVWISFDAAMFSPGGWMTRNRILHPRSGWKYVGISVEKASQNKRIMDTRIAPASRKADSLLNHLRHYKKAPYYARIVELIREAWQRCISFSVADFNLQALATVCVYLGLPFVPRLFSQLDVVLPPVKKPGHWALELCLALGADHYINAPGGRNIYFTEDFAARGVLLEFLGLPDFSYTCPPFVFEPGLSILDVLMWNSPESVKAHLTREMTRHSGL
jgi:hypothetical protein